MIRKLGLAAVMLAALALAACGGDGDGKVPLELSEYALAPGESSVTAGEVTFDAKNVGAIPHELVVIRTDTAVDELSVVDGKVDEAQAGTVIGRTSILEAGAEESASFTLEAGKYALICNLAGHYQFGMRAAFEVQ